MDLHKLIHHVDEIIRGGYLHFSLFAGLFGAIKGSTPDFKDQTGDLGETPGDNFLPKEILISLSSRRGL